ncbi:iron transporter [Arthrobacter sp. NicSoilB4]|uniref:Nramp family divalent metal transporter n=1 Tax=Arthrobacter sp. NicSoilB4 TaxID=2830997 RepID=UPI001CC37BC5|nr:Nramp family divalent metal transporter [Arthrobacter sp. NicSoilB4]BCW66795.1 iron transporter [Arthrobacter sp. NicSoilB4]
MEKVLTQETQQVGGTSRWRRIAGVAGPGFIVAAAGVGAGDLIASLNAGASFGLTLAWAVVVGCFIKFIVTECIGRWSLATDISPLRGFHQLSKIFTGYFGIYSIILGFFYGAAIAGALGLTVHAMFPAVDIKVGAIVAVLCGLGILWIGKYSSFEKLMSFFVAVMFISIVGAAILTKPDLSILLSGLTPRVPEDGTFYVLGVMGGVGMSIGLLSYGYWLRDRGWNGPSWIKTMRLDLVIGYGMTFIFMFAMMIVGAAFLQGTGTEVGGLSDLNALATPFAERFGEPAKWLLLIGMFSAVFSSLIGGYNALANVFNDIFNIYRKTDKERDENAARSVPFRAYILWMCIPPLAMLFLDKPVTLVLIYAALGALLMPVMIGGLLWLMNSKHLDKKHRNGLVMNASLVLGLVIFVGLGLNELLSL